MKITRAQEAKYLEICARYGIVPQEQEIDDGQREPIGCTLAGIYFHIDYQGRANT